MREFLAANPIAKPSDVRAAYDEWHYRHEPDPAADAPWYALIKSRLRLADDLAGRRVLEIGCGLGGFAVWLSRQSQKPAEVVAADFSPVAVARARQLGEQTRATGIHWIVADIMALDEFQAGFDTVFSCETIEHVPDPPLAVRQLSRVLKPGGRLYLTTPNYLSMIGLYRAYCWLRRKKFDEGGQPICKINMSVTTRSWVRKAGLRVVRTDGVGHYLPLPRRSPIRFTVLDRARFLTRWFAHHTLVIAEKPAHA